MILVYTGVKLCYFLEDSDITLASTISNLCGGKMRVDRCVIGSYLYMTNNESIIESLIANFNDSQALTVLDDRPYCVQDSTVELYIITMKLNESTIASYVTPITDNVVNHLRCILFKYNTALASINLQLKYEYTYKGITKQGLPCI